MPQPPPTAAPGVQRLIRRLNPANNVRGFAVPGPGYARSAYNTYGKRGSPLKVAGESYGSPFLLASPAGLPANPAIPTSGPVARGVNLAFPSPGDLAPLTPTQTGGNTYTSQGFNALTDGAALASPYPVLTLVSEYKFTFDVALYGILFTTSLLNVDPGVQTMALILGQANQVSINNVAGMIVLHGTLQNSLTGAPSPTNRGTNYSFDDNTAMIVKAGQRIGIYGCSDENTNGTDQLFGMVNLYYKPVSALPG